MALLHYNLIRCVLNKSIFPSIGKSLAVPISISYKNNWSSYSTKTKKYVNTKHIPGRTVVSSSMEYFPDNEIDEDFAKEKLSKATRAFMERSRSYEGMMSSAREEYHIGMRHLANMMGESPETFTQADANAAVEYLFPSALYEKRARPSMKPVEEVFPQRKIPQWDDSGRPKSSLFYTVTPNFYQLCHDAVGQLQRLDEIEYDRNCEQKDPDTERKLNLGGTQWLKKDELENALVELLSDAKYDEYIKTMDRLASHPYAYEAEEFIRKQRKEFMIRHKNTNLEKPVLREDGRQFVTIKRSRRKTACADVTVIVPGSGQISINDQSIEYFKLKQSRQQLYFPLDFTKMRGKVDIVATVTGGGYSGQSGAIRLGIATGLSCFVDEQMVEDMRMAGLLTRDVRRRERKKPGQEGARRKFTWKRR